MYFGNMYSNDFKTACLRLYRGIGSFRKVAECVGSSASSICRWFNAHADASHTRKKRASILDKPVIIEAVTVYMTAHPFTTAIELQNVIRRVTGSELSHEMVRLAMKKSGYTRKRPRFYAMPQHLESATTAFLQAKHRFRKRLIVPIDETGFSSNVKPVCGYAPRGARLHIRYMPTAVQKKHTSVVAMADPRSGNIVYQSTVGHYTEERFLAFLKLLTLPKRTVLLMDNVRFHHGRKVKALATERSWDILYTPPYSPWFNPIERIFSIVKASFRRCRSIPDSFDVPVSTVKNILASRCLA